MLLARLLSGRYIMLVLLIAGSGPKALRFKFQSERQMSFAKSIFVITCLCLTVILLPVNGANPPSSGSASEASNQPNNQPNPAGKRQLPFKVGNVVSRTVQKVTGLTLVSEIVASQAAKAAV